MVMVMPREWPARLSRNSIVAASKPGSKRRANVVTACTKPSALTPMTLIGDRQGGLRRGAWGGGRGSVVRVCTKRFGLTPMTLIGNRQGYSISESWRGSVACGSRPWWFAGGGGAELMVQSASVSSASMTGGVLHFATVQPQCRVTDHLSVCAGHRSASRRCIACQYARYGLRDAPCAALRWLRAAYDI